MSWTVKRDELRAAGKCICSDCLRAAGVTTPGRSSQGAGSGSGLAVSTDPALRRIVEQARRVR